MQPSSPESYSRRTALKKLGATAALVGLAVRSGAQTLASTAQSTIGAGGIPQPFVLPKLGYAYDALEPHIDARTMEIHYTKHHQAYITNANNALADYPDLRKLTAEQLLGNLDAVPEKIRTAVRNNVGGHVNHSFFWKTMAPHAGGDPVAPLGAALAEGFGSIDKFKSQFSDAAMKRFGSGWAWLVLKKGQLAVVSTANQDSPISDGAVPLLGLDVWEHAYYLKHQNVRADYVAAFWSVISWPKVAELYSASKLA